MKTDTQKPDKKPPGVFSLLKPYMGMVSLLLLFALLSNGVNLWLPKIIASGIDDYAKQHFVFIDIIKKFSLAVLFIFVFSYLQTIIQTYASERVARDLRQKLADKISRQSHAFIEKANPSKLLTNLTADVDSIKLFVSQALVSIVSSLFIIIGASILLFTINWKLALAVITIIPIIGGTFFYVLKNVRALFIKSRGVIDQLNKVINESILGAALIRVINSQQLEYNKFLEANTEAKQYGLKILGFFAGLIPIVTFTANMAALTILMMGGHFVIKGSMTLGSFAAFNSYLSLLIFPIFILGFMSNLIAQASASFTRISVVLDAPDMVDGGTLKETLRGDVEFGDVTLVYGQKPALKNVSFLVTAGSKIAIIGPTAAGKTQLLYLLTNLINPTSGYVHYDGRSINDYNSESFHSQVGFVFQDSIIFNMSIRENIAFSDTVTDESLEKAIETAELRDFIASLPDKLNTIVSERGSSLSGGQKQRIMLARALAVNPKVLLLDDFTARVDTNTEKKILGNIQKNYPGLTLISVTQKIASVEHYDQILLLTQGEIVARGVHDELMLTSPDYVQIFNSQQSTSNYEHGIAH
ncbi:ATP-binding cassette, subfamily B [Mucilaginibacter lappiensis]|uniref:ATP-binding cassette subfamily B protein n=1 Tax=Mucilaginibacter lappiensis TaxID=354630 RepID=A0ABR6PQ57_9SPHI|nr:ABC transporter ATP-binding protein [Mucilaginibacter lappiensis]MBB6111150.1 ATP-binding cassette subfamily B protein [Mucilaginibacter lappiensis]SIR70328.1 ATP-binding cassette, subfamily B [Mucilaginibacter lappiensis]